jgi:hypothetical protein
MRSETCAIIINPNDIRQRKAFFFEKKKQKTFDYSGFGLPGETEAEFVRVFWFFFSIKNRFLLLALARR